MAGFAFNNSPAFSQDPRRAAEMAPSAPQFGQQQYGQQAPQYGQQAPQFAQPGAPVPTPEQLGSMYDRPVATPTETGRMTYDGVIMKTLATLGAVAAGFIAVMAVFFAGNAPLFYGAWIGGMVVGFVLALVNIFKKMPSPALVLAYGVAQGLAIGGISVYLEFGPSGFSGIIFQALLATACVFAATLALYAFRIVRVTPKATRFFFIVMIAYALFSLVNLVLMLTGVVTDPWGLRSATLFGIPLGVLLGGLAVLLGAYSLMLDFNSVETGVKRGAPAIFGWQAAFGITMTVIWLYVELLRLIAILRR